MPRSKPRLSPGDLHQINDVQASDRPVAIMRKPVENIYASRMPGCSHPNHLARTNLDNIFRT